ncbi:MAG: MotA/TolQ/ExbB proton channel family protein [Salinibacterium sp.]|nr:MotA/TolQ/ExbB proton channel family protein [Salinibacterium sp.]
MLTLAQASDAPSRSLLDYIADGRQVGFIIIGLSITVVVLIIIQLVRLQREQLAPGEQVARLGELLRRRDLPGALAYCQDEENSSFLTRVFGAALLRVSRSPFGGLELRTALEEAGQAQTARLYRGVDAIAVIASVAPMLGLLGTTIGMVGAFDTLRAGGGVARPDQLAGDISVALITTVLGLIVAIPSTAVHALLRNRVESLVGTVAEIIEDLAAIVEAGGQQPQRQAPSAASRPTPPRAGVGSQVGGS